MEHRLGCTPFVIRDPYPTHVLDSTRRLLLGERRRPETYYWYDDKLIAYVGEGESPYYTGPTTYEVIRRGV